MLQFISIIGMCVPRLIKHREIPVFVLTNHALPPLVQKDIVETGRTMQTLLSLLSESRPKMVKVVR